jgi:bile acid:Na+ symporter, BASS family
MRTRAAAVVARPLLLSVVPSAMARSLVLTYVNSSGALGSFLARPRPLLFAAAVAVATVVCLLSFVLGRLAARILRLEAPVVSSRTLACSMNNSSASAVVITTEKTAANRVVARPRPHCTAVS